MATPSAAANSQAQPLPDLAKVLPRLTPRRRRPPDHHQQDQVVVIPNVLPLPAPNLNRATTSSSTSDDNDDNATIAKHTFIRPTRRILSAQDHQLFLASSTYNLLVSFVFALTDAVRDRTMTSSSPNPNRPSTSPSRPDNKGKDDGQIDIDDNDDEAGNKIIIDKILQILDEVESLVRQHPAQDQQGSRFGNLAFRPFFNHVRSCLPRLHGLYLGPLIKQIPSTHANADVHTDPAAGGGGDGVVVDAMFDELSTYLLHSFGDPLRIDYGSGHELNFIVWLYVSLFQSHIYTHISLSLSLPLSLSLSHKHIPHFFCHGQAKMLKPGDIHHII